MKLNFNKTDFRKLSLFIILIILIIVFWNTFPLFPVKLFVVLLHEISHGIAAVITGGGISSISVTLDEGGMCYTYGGSQFLILSAGYLGSMLWGGLILLLSSRYNFDRQLAGIIGVLLFITGIIYVSNFTGKIFTLGFSALLIFSGYKAPDMFNDIILKIFGLTSMLYALIDILSDAVFRTSPESDASRLGELYFGNSIFWGLLWVSAGIYFFIKFLFISSEKKEMKKF
ncbi:MAG: M50 family metallopeptidase [Spirochaetes bacterium]|nr:M50 family metallopeptidase [Spirochaetota bacterium]